MKYSPLSALKVFSVAIESRFQAFGGVGITSFYLGDAHHPTSIILQVLAVCDGFVISIHSVTVDPIFPGLDVTHQT